MTYTEMQQAEAALANAIAPVKQRGATKAQLSYRELNLADALAARIAGECDCPRSELEIGGHGHYADCSTAIARAAMRRAIRAVRSAS